MQHGPSVDPPPFSTFADRLAWWRRTRGFKRQGALADVIKIKQSSLSDLETGESKTPSADTLLKLADALNLRPRYLLSGEGPAQGQSFQELTGPEAQLVMIFRQLPSDALRQALLIDADDMLERSKTTPAPARAPAQEYERLKSKPAVRRKGDSRKAA